MPTNEVRLLLLFLSLILEFVVGAEGLVGAPSFFDDVTLLPLTLLPLTPAEKLGARLWGRVEGRLSSQPSESAPVGDGGYAASIEWVETSLVCWPFIGVGITLLAGGVELAALIAAWSDLTVNPGSFSYVPDSGGGSGMEPDEPSVSSFRAGTAAAVGLGLDAVDAGLASWGGLSELSGASPSF